MIKKGQYLDGVEPINERCIKNNEFIKIMEDKICSNKKVIFYLKKILNGRDVYDKSGYSGSSTIIVNKDNKNNNSLVIKIQKNGHLKEEFITYNFYYKNGLTSKPIKYFNCGEYEFMIVEKIDLPVASHYFDSYQEISSFFGKELRKFHELNFVNHNFTSEERTIFENKFIDSFNKTINNKKGLIYMSTYMNDYNYDEMRKYLIENKDILFDDLVLLHGDFNPNNVFVDEDSIKAIDFCDSGFGDRHYDIFWTMFMIIIFSGILKDKTAILECEKIFLDSYGRDLVQDRKLEFFKKFTCLYWKQHDEITRIDII